MNYPSVRTAGLLLPLLASLALPCEALAQLAPPNGRRNGPKPGTYVKFGAAYWQGDIFREGALTRWDVNLLGSDYNLTSLNFEIERYFRSRALGLAGFSLGYRKDGILRSDSGHMVGGKLFGEFDLKAIAIKLGGGLEYGVPSLNFDRTAFELAPDGTLRYRHTHPERNRDVPFVGTRTDGAMYPFLEFSATQRPGILLFEAGLRINLMEFRFDDYEVSPGDRVLHVENRERMKVPYLFVNLGLRLF